MFIKSVFKRYLDWLFSDGLIVQVYFGICALIFLMIGMFMAVFAYQNVFELENILLTVLLIVPLCVLLLGLSLLWFSVSFLNPETKLAKIGLKLPLDDVDWPILIIIPVFFIFAASITTILRWFRIKGYPIQKYESLYSGSVK
jgi:hypothetical protein